MERARHFLLNCGKLPLYLRMEKEWYGIVGLVVGSLLSTVTTVLLDRYNRSKGLYIEGSKAGFAYPIGQYLEEPVTGHISVYLYNDSSLPKSFLLEHIKLVDQETYFSVLDKTTKAPARGVVQQVAPNGGLYLEWELSVHPDIDFNIPDIEGKVATLTYRSGKRTRSLSIPLFYYSPV